MKRYCYTIVVVLLLGAAPGLFGQIPNAGFETWVNGIPTGWTVDNVPPILVPVTQSATPHSGSYALSGAVVNYTGFGTYPPYVFSYFGFKQRPAALTGYYQFTGASSDSFSVYVVLYTGSGVPVADGFFGTKENKSSYTQFTAPLEYLGPETPDSAYIWILTIAGQNDTNHVGTQFLVDDLAFTGTATAVEPQEQQQPIPSSYALGQNYPNPFNPSTTIRYDLPATATVRLAVYNLLGEEVALLINSVQSAGSHEVRFDAGSLPSGVYLYRITAGSYADTKRMVLVR